MRAFAALPLLLAAGACATTVRHPEKTAEETSADIAACQKEVRAVHWAPLTIRTKIAECLAAKGYSAASSAVASALPEAPEAPPSAPASVPPTKTVPGQPQPCEVPCRTKP